MSASVRAIRFAKLTAQIVSDCLREDIRSVKSYEIYAVKLSHAVDSYYRCGLCQGLFLTLKATDLSRIAPQVVRPTLNFPLVIGIIEAFHQIFIDQ